ncbi:DUF3806 domain-containing protein [Tenacibaculum maritimum]|uniref:DUF3806 domain-containing protein n=1 Tax=Tenacibaculum maritimum TaxID=107401 RepID=UPI0012E54DD0|nr:DUF3806 domain-containing protein [Tenacibaculum maritimum]CAA0213303.1 hypothetical protein UCDSB2_30076 [Tenacibaculum maritimum]
MKNSFLLIIITLLISCRTNSQKEQKENKLDVVEYHISDDGVKFELQDWGQKEWNDYNILKEKSKILIRKYSSKQSDIFDSENLDLVLEKWRENNDLKKESKKEIMTLLGVGFGQDLIDSYNCDWKIYYDQQGSDFTVIHKVYKMNLFPFSTVYKAIEKNRKGSLSNLKKTFGERISNAKKGGDYTKW